MHEIERANPDTLYRVFGTADWGNREKVSDELLKDLIEGFSTVSLGNKAGSTDVLGDAYEYLVGKFADVTYDRHAGRDTALLLARRAVYLRARGRTPERWSGAVRNWEPINAVRLNPDHDEVAAPARVA